MKLGAFAPRFLLESVEGGERLARYSFIGFGDALEVRLDGAGLRIGAERRPPPADGAELLAALRAALSLAPKPQPDIAGVPLAGALGGYAGYDVARYFERPPAPAGDAGRVPLLHYVAPRSVLVFDHLTRGIALLHAGTEAERQALRAQVVRALRGALPNGRRAGRYAPPVAAFPRADYMAGVRRTQQYIAAGDVYQLVLASRFSGRHELDPFQAYRALRLINPSPYMYYCALGDVAVVGSSPEALVKLNGRRAQLRPIAGTRPRSADAAVDQAREAQLLADPKENAEHVMLVDLARNDLGRVAEAGTVRVAPSSSRRRGCEAATAADRQLRLLHLQPGAGVPGARGRGERLSERCAHAREGPGAGAHAPVHLSGARDAVRCGRIDGHDPRVRRPRPGARRVPRTPGDRGGGRGPGGARRPAHARQDLARASR